MRNDPPAPPAETPLTPQAKADDTARAAGRGGMAVLGAKVFFILVGFVQQPLLQAALGLAGYGVLSRVFPVANIVNNVVIASSTQGVSRAVSRAPGCEGDALRATMKVHAPLAVLLAVLFAAAAPLVVAFQHEPQLGAPHVALAGVVLAYGLYAPLIGALNGQRRFGRQATLDVLFACLRTAGLVGGGVLFLKAGRSGPLGAAVGFFAAAGAIVPLAVAISRRGRAVSVPTDAADPRIPKAKSYVLQLLPIAAAQLFTNLVMQADLILLGRFLTLSAGVGEAAATAANEWAGVYRSCQLFAFLPYQVLFSVTQILFPMLARAKAEGDDAAVRAYVERGARIGAIVCGVMVAVIVALPGSLLGFAFRDPSVAAGGAEPLRVLAIGQAAFALLGIALAALTSLGRELESALITLGAVVLVGVLCWVLVPAASFGQPQLVTSAYATSGALIAALIVAALRIRSVAGSFVPWKTAVRVALGVGLALLVGTRLPAFGRVLTLGASAAVVVSFVALLIVTRELGKSDVALVRAMLTRKRS